MIPTESLVTLSKFIQRNLLACINSSSNRNPKDTANYLVFIEALRKALDDKYTNIHKLITLAVGTSPFNDEKQTPIKSLPSGWAKAVDSFYLMVNTKCAGD